MPEHPTNYIQRNDTPQEQYTTAGRRGQLRPAIMVKRIGSTTFRVIVHFSDTSRETVNDKILRLIRSEATMGPPQNQKFCGERRDDGANELPPRGESKKSVVRADEEVISN